jgi:hypothetical protein
VRRIAVAPFAFQTVGCCSSPPTVPAALVALRPEETDERVSPVKAAGSRDGEVDEERRALGLRKDGKAAVLREK